jgi:hypothetical protein
MLGKISSNTAVYQEVNVARINIFTIKNGAQYCIQKRENRRCS